MTRTGFLVVAALLAGVSAQEATPAGQTANANPATSTATPAPTGEMALPTGQWITSIDGTRTTLRVYNPADSNIPSDGWVLSGSATLDGHTHTETRWVGAAKESIYGWRAHDQQVHFTRNAWRDATIGMGAVTGVTVVLTMIFAVLHVRLRAAERWRSLDASAAEAATLQRADVSGPLPAYSGERPPSYAESSRRSSSSSSSSRRAASATAIASLLPSARAYGFITDYPHGQETTTMSELPATSSYIYKGEVLETQREIPRYAVATCVGLLVPCLIMWAYIAYVIYRLVRSKRTTRGFMTDRQAPPMPENHSVTPFPTQEEQREENAAVHAGREKAAVREKLAVHGEDNAGAGMPLSPITPA